MVYHWSLKQSVDQVDRIILFLVDDFGVHLCHSHGGMAKQLRYGIEIRTERQHHGRECMPGGVKSKTLGDSGRFGPRSEILIDI